MRRGGLVIIRTVGSQLSELIGTEGCSEIREKLGQLNPIENLVSSEIMWVCQSLPVLLLNIGCLDN